MPPSPNTPRRKYLLAGRKKNKNITTTITSQTISAFSPDQRLALRSDQSEVLRSDQAAENEKEQRKSKLRRQKLQGEVDEFQHALFKFSKKNDIWSSGEVKSLINLWSSEARNSDDVSRKIQTTRAAKLQPITDQFRKPALPSTFVTKICNSVIGQEDEQKLKPTNGMKPTKQQDYRK